MESRLGPGAREAMADLQARAARHQAAVRAQVERILAVPVVIGGGEVGAQLQQNITAANDSLGDMAAFFDTTATDTATAANAVNGLLETDRSAAAPLNIRV
ncbi:hypothetical protein [Micromonospora polyrhachis]|uniref:Uncharacterized protein n=1 Tax=Micromonospora polyrhachis TaxID=1282883 RepID=A0A7W7ST37_9ACTN|nr:hypothetical protein [Micromonospora polyrhachis]MBB4960448.1 hypothetical protein [Micromonospora polyrhachis]